MKNRHEKNRKTADRTTLRRIIKLLKGRLPLIILSLAMAVSSVIFTLYIPILTGNAMDLIIGAGRVDFDGLFLILQKMLICIISAAVLQYLMSLINNRITYLVVRDLRIQAFGKLMRFPLKYLDGHSSGDLISRVINDAEIFSDGLLLGFTQLFTGVTTIVGTIIFMIALSPVISIVVIVLTPMTFLIARFISSRTYRMFRKEAEARGRLTGMTNEMLSNVRLVYAFNRQEQTVDEFETLNNEMSDYSLKATFYSSLTNPCTRFANAMIYAGVTIAGCFACFSGAGAALTVGRLTSFLSYTSQYGKPFNEITDVIAEFQNALASAARIFEILDEEELREPAGDPALPPVSGAVGLKNVFFSYSPDRPLIEDFSLNIGPGRRVAIVGPTGCGKTTLINLLMRFYEPVSGDILFDGINTRDVTRSSLRSRIGMVLQDTWLKTGSIRENIAYGWPEAPEEEIVRAAKESHAHDFIMRMPDGYDTLVSEDGENLSAGEKQLLCIARVMLRLPPILILDEATSSIDTMTELRVQNDFARMMKGRTSFIVAHRLSTIREADIILVMRDGHIVEQGTHRELLAKNGFYSELYNSQFLPSGAEAV